jgi:hypothetical protein
MNLDINKIKPKNQKISDKYSAYLYKFLMKQPSCNHVYFNPIDGYDGHIVEFDINNLLYCNIYLGRRKQGSDVIGKSLHGIITQGKYNDLGCYCFTNDWIDITEEFWKIYEQIGRCLFIGHNSWYQDDNNTRFTYTDDDTRVCNWCGKTEHRRFEEIIKHKEVWE